VKRSPDAMPTEFAHHVKTAPAHFALDRAANVLRAISSPRRAQRLLERAFRAMRQFPRFSFGEGGGTSTLTAESVW
jgi:hypothetical protein